MEGPPDEEPEIEPAPPTEEPNSEPTAGSGTVLLPTQIEMDGGSADVSDMEQSHPSGSSGDAVPPTASEGAVNEVAKDSIVNAETPGNRRRQDPPSEPTAAGAGNAPKFRRLSAKTKVPPEIVPEPPFSSKHDIFAPARALLGSVALKEEWISPFVWKKWTIGSSISSSSRKRVASTRKGFTRSW